MIIDERLVSINVTLNDNEAVLDLASNLFGKMNIIKDSYLENIKKREVIFPTGLKAANYNIAIPHTDPEHINENAIAIIIPSKPVAFKMMGSSNQEVLVDIIMPLAIKDGHEQMELLKKIMLLIQDDKQLESLVKANNKEDIVSIIKNIIGG